MRQITHWINGEEVTGTPDRTGPVFNPSTGEQAAEVALADEATVDLAVRSAKAAFETWRDSPLTRRQNIMFAFREIVASRRDEMARMLSEEHVKAFDDSLG